MSVKSLGGGREGTRREGARPTHQQLGAAHGLEGLEGIESILRRSTFKENKLSEEEIADEILHRVIPRIFIAEPLIGSVLIRALGIKLTRSVPTAATDGAWILINPDFYNILSEAEKDAVLMHEAYHILLEHPERGKAMIRMWGAPPSLVNEVADAYINAIITSSLRLPRGFLASALITPETIVAKYSEAVKDREEFLQESLENNVWKILKKYPPPPQPPGPAYVDDWGSRRRRGDSGSGKNPLENDIFAADESKEKGDKEGKEKDEKKDKGEKEGEGSGDEGKERGEKEGKGEEGDFVVKEPDEALKDGKLRDEDGKLKSPIEKAIIEGSAIAHTAKAGTVAGLVQRLVREVLRPRLDWRRLLRNALATALSGSMIRRTWGRVHRKQPDVYPGITSVGGKVVVAVDTSGSIDESTLRDFLSEVYGMASVRGFEVILFPWDVKVYDRIVLRSPQDVEKVVREGLIKGGGGTKIRRALEEVLKERNVGAVVILSDWYIFDIDEKEVRDMLRKIARKTIAVTSAAPPPEDVGFLSTIALPPRARD